jgi:hypothetical protein
LRKWLLRQPPVRAAADARAVSGVHASMADAQRGRAAAALPAAARSYRGIGTMGPELQRIRNTQNGRCVRGVSQRTRGR